MPSLISQSIALNLGFFAAASIAVWIAGSRVADIHTVVSSAILLAFKKSDDSKNK